MDGDFQEEDIWSHHVMKRKLSTAPKVIPRAKSAISNHESKVPQQSSAPVKIPDWSKIYNKKSSSNNGSVDEDCGDFGDGMVPPHEYIARRVARSQIAPSSMCEGVGRTLKGRDLSKVRNAILTKTGFLE
ncbi:protein S40-6-like [Lycium barbarum]|uniref:protein S40-6-like n=1 Tax=Lycium barbarum TaxID=112863 RepID=UPI00293F100A|nr:protein S40-6-like [Lycium barbarum]